MIGRRSNKFLLKVPNAYQMPKFRGRIPAFLKMRLPPAIAALATQSTQVFVPGPGTIGWNVVRKVYEVGFETTNTNILDLDTWRYLVALCCIFLLCIGALRIHSTLASTHAGIALFISNGFVPSNLR